MKNIILNITLLTSISSINTGLYASDQKCSSDIDKNIFTVNSRIASPYKTQFINSLSDVFFIIESDPIKILYTNAYERAISKSVISCDDFENTEWGSYMSKVINDFKYLSQLPQFIYHVTAYSGDIRQEKPVTKIVNNTLIMIPENGLFTLLQYTYGIKRDGEKTEILLNSDGTKTLSVKPLLMKILNKYRSHEQQDTAMYKQKCNATDIKEGGLYFGQ